MARTRHQEGTVEITGKKKDWTGYFYVYDQAGKRHRKSVNLGPSKGVKKWQALDKLRPIVDAETSQPVRTSGEDTLEWYYWNRFSPFQTWAKATRRQVDGIFRRHVLRQIGSTKLNQLDKYQVLIMFKRCAHLSQSHLDQMRTYLKAVCEAAIDDELMKKNPVRKMKIKSESTVARAERVMTMAELGAFFAQLAPRDQLICLIAVILGLRPGEIFALTWDRYDPQGPTLLINQSIGDRELKKTKTAASTAKVFLPSIIVQGLEWWRQVAPPGEYLFQTKKGLPIETNYFQSYIMVNAAIRAGIMEKRPKGLPPKTIWTSKLTAVNFQALRRTCGTYSAKTGTVKDVQTILRHAKGDAAVALKHYIKPIDETVKATMMDMEALVVTAINASQQTLFM